MWSRSLLEAGRPQRGDRETLRERFFRLPERLARRSLCFDFALKTITNNSDECDSTPRNHLSILLLQWKLMFCTSRSSQEYLIYFWRSLGGAPCPPDREVTQDLQTRKTRNSIARDVRAPEVYNIFTRVGKRNSGPPHESTRSSSLSDSGKQGILQTRLPTG